MIPRGEQLLVEHAEHFDASTSGIGFGEPLSQYVPVWSIAALVYVRGAGESGTNGTICAMVPSASISNGPILSTDVNAATPIIQVRVGSSGTANFPARNGANNTITYNAWNLIVATYNGGLTATSSIRIFSAINDVAIAEVAYGGAANGTGTPLTGSGNELWIGDNEANSRSFNGDIAYVARWNRVLDPAELFDLQREGPLHLSDGNILCWSGGQDYGPYGLTPHKINNIGYRQKPPFYAPLGFRRRWIAVSASSPVTGTLAVTLGDVTLAGVGVLEQEGTLAVTLADTTLVASGIVGAIDGALAVTLDDVTLAAAGTVGAAVDGSLAVTLGDVTLAGVGVLEQEGTLAVTLQDVTLFATGSHPFVGTLAVTLDNVTLAATGTTTGPTPPSYNPLALTNPLTAGITAPMTWR